jgi:hypothetical protein
MCNQSRGNILKKDYHEGLSLEWVKALINVFLATQSPSFFFR